jgi:hypothetical protein
LIDKTASGDLTAYFSEIELSTWDKVGEIKKEIEDYKFTDKIKANQIRAQVTKFHNDHPEFLSKLNEMR